MRRAIARGRILPQSLSTDPRYGRLSLKAQVLYPLLWVNCDDQGRVSGDPDEIKYAACPSIKQIIVEEIPRLLEQLETQGMIKLYTTSKTKAIQMLDWWDVQKLQWAYPSEYPPPEGWKDSLRYHPTPKEIITDNWPPPGRLASELLPSKLPSALANALPSPLPPPEELGREIRSTLMALPETLDRLAEHELIKETLAKLGRGKGLFPKREVGTEEGRIDVWWEEPSGEVIAAFEIDVYEARRKSLTKLKALDCPYPFVILRTNPEPLQWHQGILLIGLSKERESIQEKEIEKEEEKEGGRGRGILPSKLGSTSPSPTVSPVKLLNKLTECYRIGWGKVSAAEPDKVIPRRPEARLDAQMRDLAQELSSAGGCPLEYIDQAFKEAAGQGKYYISYVRAILLDWLGVARGPPR